MWLVVCLFCFPQASAWPTCPHTKGISPPLGLTLPNRLRMRSDADKIILKSRRCARGFVFFHSKPEANKLCSQKYPRTCGRGLYRRAEQQFCQLTFQNAASTKIHLPLATWRTINFCSEFFSGLFWVLCGLTDKITPHFVTFK